MAIEMSYSVPRTGLKIAGGNRDVVHIEQALSVVETLGKSHHESWARPTNLPPTGKTPVRRNYVLANEQIHLPIGEYDAHLGVGDLKIKSTGSFHELCREPGAYGLLDLSDTPRHWHLDRRQSTYETGAPDNLPQPTETLPDRSARFRLPRTIQSDAGRIWADEFRDCVSDGTAWEG